MLIAIFLAVTARRRIVSVPLLGVVHTNDLLPRVAVVGGRQAVAPALVLIPLSVDRALECILSQPKI